ncbi:leucine-rich repeats and immunoglobulin-like domains protein 3 [Halyomorpha halys]|uniref:leucine-rich repeats and immunoglobulin-like domains protein 3 n=1 Tax=Halyomorpha halys TaxID=286706 RepID=UPI0034D1689B
MLLLLLFSSVHLISTNELEGSSECPKICSCLESFVDCSDKDLKQMPSTLPHWTKILDLTNNSLQENGVINKLKNCPHLKELKFDFNHFVLVPITTHLSTLSILTISNNKLASLNPNLWSFLPNLKELDVSFNKLECLDSGSILKSSVLETLNLNNNRIKNLTKESFIGLKKLVDLKLSRNHLSHIGKDIFKQLTKLQVLELNRNKITKIEGLTFQGLDSLSILKIRQNLVYSLEDGSFWGLQKLQTLKLDHNKIKNISKGWTYGLTSLQELYLAMNKIDSIEKDSWEACKNIETLDLSFNEISEINTFSFEHLTKLNKLKLNHNMISSIQEGAFNSTPSLKILDLSNNKISWIVEDTSGVFFGLKELQKLALGSNEITSINQKAFYGLNSLNELDLRGNHIKTIQENVFANMNLHSLMMNSSSLICDCSLSWFQVWLSKSSISLVDSFCEYPEILKEKSFASVPAQGFLCSPNESPKPIITQGPESATTVSGSKINISCTAWSSSNSSLNFKWKRNNNDVNPKYSFTINNTAILHFNHVMLSHAGKYQCIVFNNFGTVYSKKATLKVLVLPVMIKKPGNLTVKAGGTAKLECAATGEPPPQVGWQKDGGIEFPAAQERRMHVMPADDLFFIINAKPVDSGLYSCIAQNSAGTVMANATLTVQEAPTFIKKMEDKEVKVGMSTVFECLGNGWPKPKVRWWKDGVLLVTSYRHFMTANDQLLIITDVKEIDAGVYQCEMSNLLGIETTTAHLTIKSAYSASCENMIGVIIIALVCCVVGTSALWVIIIYQTRKGFSNNNAPKHIINQQILADNKSENSSSSKDSGTGNSTKKSSEDLQLEVRTGQEQQIENGGEAQESLVEISAPLLQSSCCCSQCSDRCCSPVQREYTRSNHERCRNEKSFSLPVTECEMPVINIQPNNSMSCLYGNCKPTQV